VGGLADFYKAMFDMYSGKVPLRGHLPNSCKYLALLGVFMFMRPTLTQTNIIVTSNHHFGRIARVDVVGHME
jgi:hypothetical protein